MLDVDTPLNLDVTLNRSTQVLKDGTFLKEIMTL
jgi:hypothetical protein